MKHQPPDDPVERAFYETVMMRQSEPQDEDPYQSEEYAKFVASMVPFCRCKESNRPCDGVLAGGICDGVQEDDWERDEDDE